MPLHRCCLLHIISSLMSAGVHIFLRPPTDASHPTVKDELWWEQSNLILLWGDEISSSEHYNVCFCVHLL